MVAAFVAFLFILSVGVTYYRLIEEKRAEKEAAILSNDEKYCYKTVDSSSYYGANIFGLLKDWFSFERSDRCAEYRKKTSIDPFFKVTIGQAISVTLTETVLAPMKQIGRFMAEFFAALLNELPIHAWLPVLISIFVFIMTAFFFSRGYMVTYLVF